jgi:hypothetical protein
LSWNTHLRWHLPAHYIAEMLIHRISGGAKMLAGRVLMGVVPLRA